MNIAPFEMLVACIGAAGCWALWFYFIKEYRVAAFRERLFSLREQLFTIAVQGKMSFDDPAYSELRSLINGMIRFAHRITFLTLVTSARNHASNAADPNPYQRWKDSLSKLDPEKRTQIEKIHNQVFSAYMHRLVTGSVVLLPTAAVLLAGFVVRNRLKKFFSSQSSEPTSPRTAMEMDLAQTLNAQVLVEAAYREGKASDRLELSLA
jgi:hypothetical protein